MVSIFGLQNSIPNIMCRSTLKKRTDIYIVGPRGTVIDILPAQGLFTVY